jgi:hypothetical protein
VPLQTVLDNILDAARTRPVVIQSLFFRVDGEPPPDAEIAAYCDRLNAILDAGGAMKAIQIYTIARAPALQSAAPLGDAELDALADRVRSRVKVPVEVYYGVPQA